ncbi:MAG TPA: DUF6049 family protein [Jiangellales bacterium]|nr:DUF6049 family protein [Jiangellales bacterium]
MSAVPRAVAAAILAATVLVSAPAAPAHAQEVDVSATITTLQPAAPAPGDSLVLAGTVRNDGDEAVENVQALLRYSRDPLESRGDVRRVADDLEYRFGRRDERYFQVVADRLAPGAGAAFRLTVPVDDLGLVEAGVYAVGIDLRGTPTSGGGRVTLATERTLLPWMSGAPVAPVPVAVLWSLTAAPELLPEGTLRSDALAADVAPSGALTGLLAAAGDAPVGWLVDPDLLATLGVMAAGYEVDDGSGGTVPGTGSAAAGAWLDAYRDTVSTGDVSMLPYASPDVTALAREDPSWAGSMSRSAVAATEDAADDDAATADGETGPRRPRTDLAAPAGGSADGDGLRALAGAGITTVVLSGDAVDPHPAGPLSRVDAGDVSLDAVLTDPGLDAVASDTARTGEDGTGEAAAPPGATAEHALQARQRWLAETALAALAADRDGAEPVPLVTASPELWRPEPATARALVEAWTTTPWVAPTSLGALLGPAHAGSAAAPQPGTGQPGSEVLDPDPPESARTDELPPDFVTAVAEAQADVERYLHLLAEPDEPAAALEPALLRAASAGWRTDLVAGRQYVGRLTAEAEEPLQQVSVLVPRSVTLSSRSGVFPLTVANDLDQPVLVDLQLTPENPDRLSIEAVESLRVEAGEKAAVDVRAEAAANGSVPVVVRLSTTTGEPLGEPQELRVVATDYGAIGWLVVGVGALVLAGATAARLARRHREPAGGEREPAGSRP